MPSFWDRKPNKEPEKPTQEVLIEKLKALSTKWWAVYKWLVQKSNEAINKGIHPLDIPALEEKVIKFESDVETPLLKVMEELGQTVGKKAVDEVFYGCR